MFHLTAATLIPFFDPLRDRVARHAEGALKPTQRTALIIGAEDLLTPFVRISIARRVITAATATTSAQVALFTIRCEPEADDVLAVAMLT